MTDPYVFEIIFIVFFLAGLVKGVIGLGLPTVSLALLSIAINIPTAMSLLLLPSFVTNLWQSTKGGFGGQLLVRLWPFYISVFVAIWFGTNILVQINSSILTGTLGGLLLIYGMSSLGGFSINIISKNESIIGIFFGLINGTLTGVTGSFVFPGLLFLQGIGLTREELIQAMGILFTISTVALALGLKANNILTLEHSIWSIIALFPAIIGMAFGNIIQKKVSEIRFRYYFFLGVIIIAIFMIFKAINF